MSDGANKDENQIYKIELRGQLSEDDLNEFSPILMSLIHMDTASTTFQVRTDPSGMVGLIRCLHGRGLVLLSVNTELDG